MAIHGTDKKRRIVLQTTLKLQTDRLRLRRSVTVAMSLRDRQAVCTESTRSLHMRSHSLPCVSARAAGCCSFLCAGELPDAQGNSARSWQDKDCASHTGPL